MSDQEPLRIVLTPEQREQVRRLSGQIVEAIELEPDETHTGEGRLRLRWRPSAATGIPRQAWVREDEAPSSKEPPAE